MIESLAPNIEDAQIPSSVSRWTIAPVFILAVVVIAISAAASLRIPLKLFCPYIFWPVLISFLALLARGLSLPVYRYPIIAAILVGLVSLLLIRHNWTTCAMADSVIPTNDAWAYTTLGKYLWENSRGADTGLSISDEYASHLKDSRFAGPCLLDFLSLPNRPGDPSSAMIPFVLVCCLAMFWALFYLCRTLGFSPTSSIAAGCLGALGGWLNDAVLVGNIDTLLFTPLFTASVGALIASGAGIDGLRIHGLGLVACASAAFYCYPEGFGIGSALALPIAGWALYKAVSQRRIGWLAIVFLAAVLITSPYIGLAVEFFRHQFVLSRAAIRPGEGYFTGLLRPYSFLPAIYALGEEYPNSDVRLWNWLLPVALSALVSLGIWRLKRRAPFFVLSLAPLAVLSGWQVITRYDYGLYKILLIGSFLLVPMIADGLSVAAGLIGRNHSRVIAAGAALIVLFSAAEREEDRPYAVWSGRGCVTQLRDLASLQFLSPHKAVILDISDVFLQSWAVYFMRNVNTVLPSPVGYLAMPHITPLLLRARSTGSMPVAGRLHVGADRQAVWSDGAFSVTSTDMPQITEISNPNGVETVDGEQFVWVGSEPLTLTVSAPQTGRYILWADGFVLGPSLPGKQQRAMKIDQGADSFTININPNSAGIPVVLPQGASIVKISCLDQRTVVRLSNGDTRPLLLGIKGLSISGEGPVDR